jgi:putative membrane protein insertion efficiency factor
MKNTACVILLLLIAVPCFGFWDSEWDGSKKKDLYSPGELEAALETETSCFKIAGIAFIRFYQGTLSEKTGTRCVFYPSCSRFGVFAVKKYGVIKGILMSTDRILRCNPWADGYETEKESGLFIDPPENESAFDLMFEGLNF